MRLCTARPTYSRHEFVSSPLLHQIADINQDYAIHWSGWHELAVARAQLG